MLGILLQITLADGAPFYAETQANALIKEPWNALSSLAFLVPVFYWLYKLRGNYNKHAFLVVCMPFLFWGGVGSTLFHAFRSSRAMLALDILPILFLFVLLTLYFWYKALPNVVSVIAVFALYIGVSWWIIKAFDDSTSININYFWRGVSLFLPAVLLLRRVQYKGTFILVSAIFWFVLALVFRTIDKEPMVTQIMYMGSHWLWHISAAIGAFYLADFLYFLPIWEREVRVSKSSS